MPSGFFSSACSSACFFCLASASAALRPAQRVRWLQNDSVPPACWALPGSGKSYKGKAVEKGLSGGDVLHFEEWISGAHLLLPACCLLFGLGLRLESIELLVILSGCRRWCGECSHERQPKEGPTTLHFTTIHSDLILANPPCSTP